MAKFTKNTGCLKLLFKNYKTVILIIFFYFPVNAQYTKDDSALVRTTFTREFNPVILNEYLFSPSPVKVKAALLSISNSSDTSFVDKIIKLDYKNFEDEICFTIGQLGVSEESENFLLSKLNSDQISSSLLQALGKCGDKKSFDIITDKYPLFKDKFDGISPALFYFNSRNLIDKEKALPILTNELRDKSYSKERQADAAIAIFRSNLAADFKNIIPSEIKNEIAVNDNSEAAINKVYYLLGCLRSLKYFPDDTVLFYDVLNSQDYLIKVEAAKTLCYYDFKNQQEMDAYLGILKDENPNVTRTAAASVRELNPEGQLKEYLQSRLVDKIKTIGVSENTRGELFISFNVLFNPELKAFIEEFSETVQSKYIYEAVSQQKSEFALDYLLNNYENESGRNKLIILQSLLNLQEDYPKNDRLNNALLEAIKSNFAPAAAIAADGVDSSFITENKEEISSLIIQQLEKNLNNADFIESVISLVNLYEKSNDTLSGKVIELLKISDLFAVRSFVSQKTDSKAKVYKDGSLFPSLWENAFKYSSAEIETSKGKFSLKFLPQYSPISVGNFSYLSSQGYYDNNIFHRVVPGFVIQGGDPTETGWGGPGYEIVTEGSNLVYHKGITGMASAGKDTEGSQWFVTTGYYPHLNGRYAIFAEVTSGMDIIYRVDQDDEIISVRLIQ